MKRNTLLFVIGLICLTIVHFYPVGDWVTGPILTMFVMIPLLMVQLGLLIILKAKNKKIAFIFQIGITLFLVTLTIIYILSH